MSESLFRRFKPGRNIFDRLNWIIFCTWELLVWSVAIVNLVDTYSDSLPPLTRTLVKINDDAKTITLHNVCDDNFNFTPNFHTRTILIVDYLLLCHCFIEFMKMYFRDAQIAQWSLSSPADQLATKIYRNILIKRRYCGRRTVAAARSTYLFLCQCISLIIILLLNKDTTSVIRASIMPTDNHNTTTAGKNYTLASVIGWPLSNTETSPFVSLAVTVLMLQLALLAYQVLTELLLSVSSGMREQLLVKMNVDKDVARGLSVRMDRPEVVFFCAFKRNDVAPKLLSLMVVKEGGDLSSSSSPRRRSASVPRGCPPPDPEAKIRNLLLHY